MYSQIRAVLLELIDRELTYDAALPSERDLADRFGVARMTARKTIDQLVKEGRVYRVPGRGAFVARPQLVMPLTLRSFTDDITARGMQPDSRELTRSMLPADADLAAALDLPLGEPVHLLERLRLADGEAIAIERSHLPARRTPGLLEQELNHRSLYALLEAQYGLVINGGEQTISATVVASAAAKLLGIPKGAPALCFERRSLTDGVPLEYAISTYRADRYQLRVTFNPAPHQR